MENKKTFWEWLINSSSDPEKLSLTIKGAIVFVPLAYSLLQFFGVSISPETLTQAVVEFAALVSGIAMVYGLGRKFFLTFKK